MAEATTKIYHNTTDSNINVIGLGEVRSHDHVSITTKYHQPVVLENYPGLVEVTDMTDEDQRAFYEQEAAKIDEHAAPRVAELKKADDAANAAELAAKADANPPVAPVEPTATPTVNAKTGEVQ